MFKTIRDLEDVQNKRILVRVDFNVPLNDELAITDSTRIEESLETLRYLAEKGAKLILVSHLGRPKGEVKDDLRLKQVADKLKELIAPIDVQYVDEVYSPKVVETTMTMPAGSILLLDNIRFEPGETKNDPEFAKKLASLADIYVNDAFGAAHRAHASTEGVTKFIETRVAGLLMEREIKALSGILIEPEMPYTAIIGGSKISSKIKVLKNLIGQVNNLVIGGGMMFTFLKAKGCSIGSSLVEDDYVDVAKQLMKEAPEQNTFITLARDVVIADKFAADAATRTVQSQEIPDGWMGLDIGPESIEGIQQLIKNSKTVLWNGPLGVFEMDAFAEGTRQVAKTLAEWTEEGHCKSVLGGGDTLAAIDKLGISQKRYTHVSTGGGATLEFIEGKPLPGIQVLENDVITV